ncbi:MAG: type II toxin-antitoxin system VapC family toxin [Thermoflexales bacterium]|nr:type II toxin-antitoxin system VapC family toxin [Thermoflexales bacterium]
MKIYLDTSVLVVFLYGEIEEPERFRSTRALFNRIEAGEIEAVISFYAMQEIYGYIVRKSPPEDVDVAFRTGMLALFSLPLVVVPYLDRTRLEAWRRKTSARDVTDIPHLAVAMERRCDVMAAYDETFRQAVEGLAYHTPEELV